MTACISDQASNLEAFLTELSIQNSKVTSAAPKPNGYCHNCDEKIDGSFCDADCREDWEKRSGRTR